MRWLAAICVASMLSVAHAADDVEALLTKIDDLTRGASSVSVMEMHVKTSRYERTMKMKAWAEGEDKTLVRILEPAKDAGVSTLKVGDNLWNYLPKVDRTMKVPAGMMSGSWMGSHITNDDLVQENRLSDDYTWTVDQRPEDGEGQWTITLTPRPERPIVWGKVVVEIRPDELPIKTTFYDEKDNVARTFRYDDYTEMDGRRIPRVMRVEPADEPGEFTEMRWIEIDFGVEIPDSTFSLQALKK